MDAVFASDNKTSPNSDPILEFASFDTYSNESKKHGVATFVSQKQPWVHQIVSKNHQKPERIQDNKPNLIVSVDTLDGSLSNNNNNTINNNNNNQPHLYPIMQPLSTHAPPAPSFTTSQNPQRVFVSVPLNNSTSLQKTVHHCSPPTNCTRNVKSARPVTNHPISIPPQSLSIRTVPLQTPASFTSLSSGDLHTAAPSFSQKRNNNGLVNAFPEQYTSKTTLSSVYSNSPRYQKQSIQPPRIRGIQTRRLIYKTRPFLRKANKFF